MVKGEICHSYEREAWNRWDVNVKIKLHLTYLTGADEEAIEMTRM